MVSELGSSHLNVRGTVSELGSPSPTVGCTFLGGGGTKLSHMGLTQHLGKIEPILIVS